MKWTEKSLQNRFKMSNWILPQRPVELLEPIIGNEYRHRSQIAHETSLRSATCTI